MKSNPIEEDIRSSTFRRVYLLYGEEDYLKRYYCNELKKAILPDQNTINLAVWQGENIDLVQLRDLADTMPFFAAHRLIIVEDSGLFKAGGMDLADYLPNMPEETVIIFVEKEVDSRQKLYKAAKEIGCLLKCDRQDSQRLTAWAVRRLDRNGKKIQRSAMNVFLERTGDDMYRISNELEKLICYVGERNDITLEDVQAVTTVLSETRIFDMIDALSEKRVEDALRLYDELLYQRESPVGILVMLSRQFTRLLQIKEMRESGLDRAAIGKALGLKDFAVRINLRQCENFTRDELRLILERCVRTDEGIKTGRGEGRMSVQTLLLQIMK